MKLQEVITSILIVTIGILLFVSDIETRQTVRDQASGVVLPSSMQLTPAKESFSSPSITSRSPVQIMPAAYQSFELDSIGSKSDGGLERNIKRLEDIADRLEKIAIERDVASPVVSSSSKPEIVNVDAEPVVIEETIVPAVTPVEPSWSPPSVSLGSNGSRLPGSVYSAPAVSIPVVSQPIYVSKPRVSWSSGSSYGSTGSNSYRSSVARSAPRLFSRAIQRTSRPVYCVDANGNRVPCRK